MGPELHILSTQIRQVSDVSSHISLVLASGDDVETSEEWFEATFHVGHQPNPRLSDVQAEAFLRVQAVAAEALQRIRGSVGRF